MNNPSPPQHTDLHREIRTTLARLELCSSAKTQTFNPGGGRSTDEHPGGKRPPGGYGEDGWYRDRLNDLDHGRPRRVPRSPGDNVKVRDSYTLLLGHARAALAALTGRNDKVPARHTAQLDNDKGIREAIEEEAPGRSADDVAARLGLSVFIVRRVYLEMTLDTLDGRSVTTPKVDRTAKVAELKAKGLTSRQIAQITGMHQTQVMREMRRAA